MSYRKVLLANNNIYHVYNRGVEKRPIFLNRRDYLRFMELVNYYRFTNCPTKYSYFKSLPIEQKEVIFQKLQNESSRLVEMLAFCLMPNHIHFLLKQSTDNGISKFMAKTTNGFSHYFNIRHERIGHLFQGNFKAVRIETDEQLIHVSRYIHLNPVSSHMIQLKDLESYPYSSYIEYTNKKSGFCNPKVILSYFKSVNAYKNFVADQVNYARILDNIKHLTIEDKEKQL